MNQWLLLLALTVCAGIAIVADQQTRRTQRALLASMRTLTELRADLRRLAQMEEMTDARRLWVLRQMADGTSIDDIWDQEWKPLP